MEDNSSIESLRKCIGLQIGELTVTDVIDSRHFKCKCSCGNIEIVEVFLLNLGLHVSCGHDNPATLVDIKGKVYGDLTVITYVSKLGKWLCRCTCGKLVLSDRYRLESGSKKSCGHKDPEYIIGKKYGELEILDYDLFKDKWFCKCSCGNTLYVNMRDFKSGNTKSCGHLKDKTLDYTGKVIGELTAKKRLDNGKWLCECSCGNSIEVPVWELSKGSRTDCGDYLAHKTNLIGNVYGELTVIGREDGKWLCKCKCGNEHKVKTSHLTRGLVTTCGHNKNRPRYDLTGWVSGELTAIEYVGKGNWDCLCSCGEHRIVRAAFIRDKVVKSCGHLKVVDLVGETFGELKVLKRSETDGSKWVCKCSCGNIVEVSTGSLKSGGYKSCGHIKASKFVNILGETFGELTVTKYIGNQLWECKCSCGNIVNVLGNNLRSGGTKSCGCKTQEIYKQTMLDNYGEVASAKIDKPREKWQIDTIEDKDALHNFIVRAQIEHDRLLFCEELAELLGVTRATLEKYIELYGIDVTIARSTGTSQAEVEIYNLVKEYGFISKDRTLIKPLELDMVSMDRRVAIEFNGVYWHSSDKKNRLYHQNKTKACKDKGIRLIHIFEHEWSNDLTRIKVINLLKNILDTPKSIGARNTVVLPIENSTAADFLNKYHIQGNINSAIRYGCYYNNELIGVMTFGNARFDAKYQYELLRLAWKPGYRVIGGANKLFKRFVNDHNPESIVTYADAAKFTGEVYNKLGFKYIGMTEPGYTWVDKALRIKTRVETQKHKLIELYPECSDMSENEIMAMLGYMKIYNSGNYKFVWNKEI